jgi:hypothetical protein
VGPIETFGLVIRVALLISVLQQSELKVQASNGLFLAILIDE